MSWEWFFVLCALLVCFSIVGIMIESVVSFRQWWKRWSRKR